MPFSASVTQGGAGSPPPLVEMNQAILAWSYQYNFGIFYTLALFRLHISLLVSLTFASHPLNQCYGSGSAWIRIHLAVLDPDTEYLECGFGSRSLEIDHKNNLITVYCNLQPSERIRICRRTRYFRDLPASMSLLKEKERRLKGTASRE